MNSGSGSKGSVCRGKGRPFDSLYKIHKGDIMEGSQNLRGVGKQVVGTSDKHSANIMKGLVEKKVRFEVPKEKSFR